MYYICILTYNIHIIYWLHINVCIFVMKNNKLDFFRYNVYMLYIINVLFCVCWNGPTQNEGHVGNVKFMLGAPGGQLSQKES